MSQYLKRNSSQAIPVPAGWMAQFRYFISLFEKIKKIPGDVVECGVGVGSTFSMLAYLIGSEANPSPRKLWGFDSFEGFPEPSEQDISFRNPQKGEWKVDQKAVLDLLEASGIHKWYPDLNIQIVSGFFDKSLPNFPTDRQIAFLHADADLYASYHDILEYLWDRVSPSGVVCFDEYKDIQPTEAHPEGEDKWPGATKAIDEFFAGKFQTIVRYPETNKHYLVKK